MPFSNSLALFLVGLMLCKSSASMSTAVGTVYVKFDSYRQQDPNSCDTGWFLRDECDPYFIIAVSTPSRVLATFYSTEINNAPIVSHFSNRIGQLTNPMEFHFTSSDLKATDSLQLSVIVKDKNSGADTFMCDFSQVLNASSVALFANNTVNSSWSGQLTELRGSRPGHRLKLAVWIKCRPNFYQAGCSVHCDPSRFRCGPDGSRICPAGYAAVNGSCAPSDGCLRPGFCLNGGRCSAGLRGEPVCECAANFAGPRCQLETHPCLRNATWCSRGTCQTFSSNGTSACVCDKGFTGYHCDQDVDECRLVAGLCGSNGHCVNSVGSFRCVCADGFAGPQCQFQQTTSPRESETNSAATPDTEAASILRKLAPGTPTQLSNLATKSSGYVSTLEAPRSKTNFSNEAAIESTFIFTTVAPRETEARAASTTKVPEPTLGKQTSSMLSFTDAAAPTAASLTTLAAPTTASLTTSAAPTKASPTTLAVLTTDSLTTSAAPTAASPISAAPTAASPTTSAAPTTASPTTSAAPTTASLTTSAAPTTASLTTSAAPTTASPNTASPTTSSTLAFPTTASPTAATFSTTVSETSTPASSTGFPAFASATSKNSLTSNPSSRNAPPAIVSHASSEAGSTLNQESTVSSSVEATLTSVTTHAATGDKGSKNANRPRWKLHTSGLNLRTVSLVLMGCIILVLSIMVAIVVGFIVFLHRSRNPRPRTIHHPLDDRERNGSRPAESLELRYGGPSAGQRAAAATRHSESVINSAYEEQPRVQSYQWQKTQSFSWHQA